MIGDSVAQNWTKSYQLSPGSLLWTQFWAFVDTTWTPNQINATTKFSLSDERPRSVIPN